MPSLALSHHELVDPALSWCLKGDSRTSPSLHCRRSETSAAVGWPQPRTTYSRSGLRGCFEASEPVHGKSVSTDHPMSTDRAPPRRFRRERRFFTGGARKERKKPGAAGAGQRPGKSPEGVRRNWRISCTFDRLRRPAWRRVRGHRRKQAKAETHVRGREEPQKGCGACVLVLRPRHDNSWPAQPPRRRRRWRFGFARYTVSLPLTAYLPMAATAATAATERLHHSRLSS